MASINKVILIGNLGRDPEVRYMPSGEAVASITVATTDKWKDKTSGEQKEATEWHRVSAFGKLAEIMSQYLKKGAQVYIEGKLKTRKYTDKDGVEKYATDIIADTMQMLGSRGGADRGVPMDEGYAPAPATHQNPPPMAPARPQAARPVTNFPPMEDDDIPF